MGNTDMRKFRLCFWNKTKSDEPLDTKKYRREMYSFFKSKGWSHCTTITKVSVFKEGSSIMVEVETHRPGILIGKAGKFVTALAAHLRKSLEEDITVNVTECRLWYKLYN